MRLIDMKGKRYGRLVVLHRVGSRWLCKCDCGKEHVVMRSCLIDGKSKSCGCWQRELARERARTHGRTGTPTYHSWQKMMARCFDPRNNRFHLYGGRGITVCDRWKNSLTALVEDMGERPPGTTIDRIDVNGNYEPGNCRWATPKVQGRNTRVNHRLTYNGQTLCMAEWAELVGLQRGCLRRRLKRGWSIEKALTAPLQTQRNNAVSA